MERVRRVAIGAGKPGRLPRLASYGAWSDLVRSALVWLGWADQCASIEATRENDPTLQQRAAFFRRAHRCAKGLVGRVRFRRGGEIDHGLRDCEFALGMAEEVEGIFGGVSWRFTAK